MRAIGNIIVVIGLAGVTLGLLALIPMCAMNVGAARESGAQLGLFRLYSALYYADHPDAVEALSCNRSKQEDTRTSGHVGRRLYRGALDCIQPKVHRTSWGWCPAIVELAGLCTSVAYPAEARQLPDFEERLRQHANHPCAVDETRGRELLRSIYMPNEAPAKSMPNAICLRPRVLVIHYIDKTGASQQSNVYFPFRWARES